jgi:hypothetical protein
MGDRRNDRKEQDDRQRAQPAGKPQSEQAEAESAHAEHNRVGRFFSAADEIQFENPADAAPDTKGDGDDGDRQQQVENAVPQG